MLTIFVDSFDGLNCVNRFFKNYEQLAEDVKSYPCLCKRNKRIIKRW